MGDELDLWNVLTNLADDYQTPEAARPEASTVLLSLPNELLLKIINYSKFSDARSLALVCKKLNAMAIYRLYATVALYPGQFVPKGLRSKLEKVSTEEFLRLHADAGYRRGGLVGGLLARQAHLDAVRTLIISDPPGSCVSDYGRHANAIVREVISRARGLRHISLPSMANYTLDPENTLALDLRGIQFPASLKSVCIAQLPLGPTTDLQPMLANISSLDIQGLSLRHLNCTWDLGDVKGTILGLDTIHNFIRALSNLKTLAITVYYNTTDDYIRTSSDIFDFYADVIKPLKSLRKLTALRFMLGGDYDRDELDLEPSRVLRFTKAHPSLEQLTLPITWWTNVTWKRCIQLEEDEETVVWLPDPAIHSRWRIWFDMYTIPELVGQRMHQFWGSERRIPSIVDLQKWFYRDGKGPGS
ncbi:SubName: Full=Uncharacterized protein {ECO:0000313/EMBL:CCA73058.1} [Serendipita indica DSM 11827]|nr:SubName: Full=Uncharacterized protein {ECO:0000313/EMBL:CCA73058.1} [Serendipita indica DSM 11827]